MGEHSNQQSRLVRLSLAELVLLNNALNEVLHGIEVPEFSTRLGASQAEAERLLARIGRLVEQPDVEPGAAADGGGTIAFPDS